MAVWTGRAAIRGGSSETVRMVLLTCISIGVSFTWGVEMTYCTPYLLSLGLSKGQTSLVWVAGPLSGLIVQPVIGAVSDGWRSKWGRRRPFIALCSGVVAVSMVTLGFTRDVVSALGVDVDADGGATAVVLLAVLALYVTDFAINAVMSCARSLVVDTLPVHKQQAGAAWSSRMGAIGHMVGYGAGAVDLVALLGPRLGSTQFRQLTLMAAAAMVFFSGVTCWAVEERVLAADDAEEAQRRPALRFKVVRQIWSTLVTLPVRIRAICWAVFWSWIGWYPFMIYSSTWVGETYFRYDVPADAKSSTDTLGEMGRIGSYALSVYSIITFLGAWLLPPLVRSPEEEDDDDYKAYGGAAKAGKSAVSLLKPDLLTVWTFGYVMFAAVMFVAPLASSFRFATALVALCGIPWTISSWAPTALMGVEVNRLTQGDRQGAYRRVDGAALELSTRVGTEEREQEQEQEEEEEEEEGNEDRDMESGRNNSDSNSSRNVGGSGGGDDDDDGGGELSGIYFGILNIYTTLPQFIGTFISAVVFAVLEPGKSPELMEGGGGEDPPPRPSDGPNAIGVCFFIGSISAVAAAYATRRLRYL